MKNILILFLFFPLIIFSQDQKRLALVIGNSNYDESPLNNPVNDALLIAKTLKKLNFDVILDTNLANKSDFEAKVIEFGDKRADYDVGFIYYAGHGIQVGSENYLLPTKATFKKETDVRIKALNVQDIMMYLTGELDQINILILDACRDNPYERNWKKTRSSKGSGLVRITPPAGSMIAYSTDEGMTAHDGEGKNSIYCRSLSENLLKPNVEINQVFKNVRAQVLKETENYQSPVENSKLTGDEFYVNFLPNLKKDRKIIFNSDEDMFSMFYNVENLFDTIDNPNTNDESFLPNGEKKWNSFRYSHKLQQLARVFGAIKQNKNNNKLPDIIGLCEVENKEVIVDLLKDTVFSNHNYSILHQNSPDFRGIDCALLFNKKFELLKNDFIKINNPDAGATRDIVYAKLKYNNYILNVFVNHWPSRWGGQEVSNPKRVFVANVLKDYIKNNVSNDEYTLIMGDFNDYPSNESLEKVLVKDNLFNLMQSDLLSGIGSYNWRGNWNWLDQIILSNNFINDDLRILSGGSFEDDANGEDFVFYINAKGDLYPSRTFGGDNWFGGFSDHLPVYSRFGFICR